MQDLNKCEPREAFALIAPLVSRSLLLRGSEAAASLRAFLSAADEGELLLAHSAYHELVAALLAAPARRVSGDLWRDYLLYLLLCTPHAFARQAAAGQVDDAVRAMMAEELCVLGSLSTLCDELLIRLAQSQGRARKLKPRQARDNIEMFSTAVWSGGSGRSLPTPAEQQSSAPTPLSGELQFTSWKYAEPALHGSYVADGALEELYARLLESPNWAAQLEGLRCFFGSYGCGSFLCERAFRFIKNELVPLPRRMLAPLLEPVCFPAEHEQILDNVIRFMQGESAMHMLLCGGAGMGKSAQVYSVVHELPEARLVCADADADFFRLFALLSSQPFRFILLLDDVSPQALCGRDFYALPENVLVIVTTRESAQTLEWAQRIAFPSLKAERFRAFVEELLEQSYVICDAAELHNACVDYQVDARSHLSVAAALRLAERFRVQGA